MSSCSIFFSRKSCFFVSISSVSRSLWRASCVVGAPRDRWCLDFEELDEEPELELPLNNFDILLMFCRLFHVSEVRIKLFQTPRICVIAPASRCFHVQVRWRRIFRIGGSVNSTRNGWWMHFFFFLPHLSQLPVWRSDTWLTPSQNPCIFVSAES